MSYKPLPPPLHIGLSPIEGYGLFTSEALEANIVLGVSHVKDSRFLDGYVRTPLGGFYNHSDNPNCEAINSGDFILLRTIAPILPDEELTVHYTLYIPEDHN